MKVIFLDFDGVLNSERSIYAFPMQKIPNRDPEEKHAACYLRSKVDPVAVAILNKIIKATGAKIVVSSSNRKVLYLEGCIKSLKEMGVDGEVIGITPNLGTIRGLEIQQWLDEHDDVEAYVIIDDSADMTDEQKANNFVRVNGEMGLSFSNSLQAQRILGIETSPIIIV